MSITCAKVGVWILDDAYKKIASGCWVYDPFPDDIGSLWSWGYNSSGQLGDNTLTCRSSPIQVPGTQWSDVAGGINHTLATKSDGTLWIWGSNSSGQLGNNTTIQRSSPIQIPGTQWRYTTAGSQRSFATKSDGTLWAWGCNNTGFGFGGLLGDNTLIDRSSPIQIPGTQWSEVASGTNHSLARKTDGTLWSWGLNSSGQLGDNTLTCRSSPIQVPGTQWNQISTNSGGNSLARKTDGTLWSWGNNNYGQLGDNTRGINQSSPIQIPGNQWNDISNSSNFNIASKSDGTLWAWGRNNVGQLGNNQAAPEFSADVCNRSSPVQIPGTTWNDITGGECFSLARKTDGTLWTWGPNSSGQLGDNTIINRSSPVQIPGTQWSQLSRTGKRFNLARKQN